MDLVPILPTHFIPYELMLHAYKEENHIDTFSFIERSIYSGKIEEKKNELRFCP